MSYASQLHALNNAVIDGATDDLLPLIKHARHNELLPNERLAVYRNAYLIRLQAAVYVDYPAFVHYVGEEAAREQMAQYVAQTPSENWDLNIYSIAFADFLKAQDFLPQASSIAQLESAIVEVFWGQELASKHALSLQDISLEELASKAFDLNPHSKLLALNYAVDDYIRTMRTGETSEKLIEQAEYLCVIRHENEVKRVPLSLAAYQFLSVISQANTFEDALLETASQPDIEQEQFIAQLPEMMQVFFQTNMLIPKRT